MLGEHGFDLKGELAGEVAAVCLTFPHVHVTEGGNAHVALLGQGLPPGAAGGHDNSSGRHTEAAGQVDDDGQPRPAARMLEGVEGRLAGLRGQLGLTPLALGRLLATLSQVDGDKGAEGLEALRAAGAELRAAADHRPVEGNGGRVAGELGGGGGGG